MRMMFDAFAKKLLGRGYERLRKALLLDLVVFWGLRTSGLRLAVAPFILYLTAGVFTAGVIGRALSSEDNAANLKNLFMLPFAGRELVFSYVAALGAYALFTKTAGLLAVLLAVSPCGGAEVLGSLLCAANAALMAAYAYAQKKRRGACLVWAGAVIAEIFLLRRPAFFLPAMAGDLLLAALLLSRLDAYSFYHAGPGSRRAVKSSRRGSALLYLLRYWMAHKNYWTNTAILWGLACVLPSFLGRMEGLAVMPVGFALLTLNTPACILLSSDLALERAVQSLPGQKRAFCVPYCLFIFLCNLTAEAVFLISWQVQLGGVTGRAVWAAVFFALQSAIGSVLLEWFCPIRGWSIENDLWHHPRKYAVPGAMLLIAAALGSLPALLPFLLLILALETALLLFLCWRG